MGAAAGAMVGWVRGIEDGSIVGRFSFFEIRREGRIEGDVYDRIAVRDDGDECGQIEGKKGRRQ